MNLVNNIKDKILYLFGSPFFLKTINYKKKLSYIFRDINEKIIEVNFESNYWNSEDWKEKRINLRNEILNSDLQTESQVSTYALLPLILNSFYKNSEVKILDWGGDTGKNTPFRTNCDFL